jgi:hypothetical protein
MIVLVLNTIMYYEMTKNPQKTRSSHKDFGFKEECWIASSPLSIVRANL